VHGSLFSQFIELMALPVVVTVILYLVKLTSNQDRPSWNESIELALEFAAVGTVACGSVFANETIHGNWGDWAQGTGLVTVLICLGLMVWLGVLRRWYYVPPVSKGQARQALLIGLTPLYMDLILLVVGYYPFQ